MTGNVVYGTPEYYKEHFADLVADVDHKEPKYGDALIDGLILAIEDWQLYHQDQAYEYSRLRERVLKARSL